MTAAAQMDAQTRLALLERDSAEMKEALNGINQSLIKLVALEERHSESREAIGRAFKQIEHIDNRVSDIEYKMPQLIETRSWVLAMFGTVLVAVGAAVLALVVK